jgi:hypothetical protein
MVNSVVVPDTALHFMRNLVSLVLVLVSLCLELFMLPPTVLAQSPDNGWTAFVNISNTPTASTNPCIVADAAGNVHVLWSEDEGGRTRNLAFNRDGSPELDSRGKQIDYLTDAGNRLYYTRWDGEKWYDPIDVQINLNGELENQEAAVDPRGILHVVWTASEGQQAKLYYSQVQASKAESAHEWSEPTMLAESVLYAYYPMRIVTDSTGGIHIIYSQVGAEPGAYVINSFDGGNTWSAPTQLYDTTGGEEGVSTMGLVADGKDRLHATWSRYDAGGNGKGIYYSQSRDLGRTWSRPLEVAVWQRDWYEVDWLTVGVVEDEIHLVWEGSADVAALNERISPDGGLTWSQPRRILPKLVGENGFSNLLVDSANQLHMFVVLRGDASAIAQGVWYTAWEKDYWQDPILLGVPNTGLYSQLSQLSPSSLREMMRGALTGNGLRYQQAAIVNGNQLFVVVVNEWDGDIWSSHTTLAVPSIRAKPYPQPTATPAPTSTPMTRTVPTPTLVARAPLSEALVKSASAGDPILIGVLPVLLLIVGIFAYIRFFRRTQV